MRDLTSARLARRETVVDISLSFLQSETLGREHKRTHFWREDTRTAGQSRAGQERTEQGSLLRQDRQTPAGQAPILDICRWRKRPLKRALKVALRMSQQSRASTPPRLGTLLSHKK